MSTCSELRRRASGPALAAAATLLLTAPAVTAAPAAPAVTAAPSAVATTAPDTDTKRAIAGALESPDRLAGDREQDERRHAAEVLAFVGVAPGMRVVDVFSAGGYYTELLARVVGPKGQVVAYNNPPYAAFASKQIAERYAGGRLPNVRQISQPIEDLGLDPQSVDAAIFIMSYHDLYWRPKDGSWPPTDPAVLLGKLYAALTPGGVVIVQDHAANPGGDPAEVVDRLHRIDPALVRRDFAAAGFVLETESALLAHPEDDRTRLVFDEAIRGKTDQFLFRFRKPAR